MRHDRRSQALLSSGTRFDHCFRTGRAEIEAQSAALNNPLRFLIRRAFASFQLAAALGLSAAGCPFRHVARDGNRITLMKE